MEARPWSLRLLPVGWSVQPVVFHPVTDAGGGGNRDFTGVHRRVLMTRWGGRNSVTRFLPTVGSLEKTKVLTVFSILTLVFSILTFVKWGCSCVGCRPQSCCPRILFFHGSSCFRMAGIFMDEANRAKMKNKFERP